MNEKRGQYAYEIGHVFPTNHGSMAVIARQKVERKPDHFRKYYTLRCGRGHQYEVGESYLQQGRLRTCKHCHHPPIAETDPDFALWFAEPQIPRERSRYSHTLADFYCQECGSLVRDKSIHTVYQRKYVPCPYCRDGMSYPERYVNAFLAQLNISFHRQYMVPFEKEGKRSHYKYDFYDEPQGILLEVHGLQHFAPDVFNRLGGWSLEMIQERDREKERFAKEVLHLQYIYLDCRKSEPDWIRKEIISKLACYPLDGVDWGKVRQDANTSMVLQMIELSKQGYTQKQIGEKLQVHPSTVCQKLKKAEADGLFDGRCPRVVQAEQNHQHKQEKRIRYLKQKMRLQDQKKYLEKMQYKPNEELKSNSRSCICCEQEYPQIQMLGSYVNTRKPIRFLCNQCGQEFECSATWFMENHACPYCKQLARIQGRIAEKYGEEIQVLSIYKNCKTSMTMYHSVCNETFQITYTDFMKRGCPVCGKRNRIIHSAETRRNREIQSFYQKLPEIEARGYTLESNVCTRLGVPHKFRCHHCGEIWEVTPSAVMHGRNHICISPCKKKTPEQFQQQVEVLVGEEYTVLSEYQNAFAHVKMRHNACGLEYSVAPAHFTSTGRRCPKCSRKR